MTARILRKMGARTQKNGVANSHSHSYQIPEMPTLKVLEETETAWSLCVPAPKALSIIVSVPYRRSPMKKFEALFTRRNVPSPTARTIAR